MLLSLLKKRKHYLFLLELGIICTTVHMILGFFLFIIYRGSSTSVHIDISKSQSRQRPAFFISSRSRHISGVSSHTVQSVQKQNSGMQHVASSRNGHSRMTNNLSSSATALGTSFVRPAKARYKHEPSQPSHSAREKKKTSVSTPKNNLKNLKIPEPKQKSPSAVKDSQEHGNTRLPLTSVLLPANTVHTSTSSHDIVHEPIKKSERDKLREMRSRALKNQKDKQKHVPEIPSEHADPELCRTLDSQDVSVQPVIEQPSVIEEPHVQEDLNIQGESSAQDTNSAQAPDIIGSLEIVQSNDLDKQSYSSEEFIDREQEKLRDIIESELITHWSPPKGLPKDLECCIKISVESDGKISECSVEKKSGVLIYDIVARSAARTLSLPRFAWGKVLTIAFKQ